MHKLLNSVFFKGTGGKLDLTVLSLRPAPLQKDKADPFVNFIRNCVRNISQRGVARSSDIGDHSVRFSCLIPKLTEAILLLISKVLCREVLAFVMAFSSIPADAKGKNFVQTGFYAL